MGCRNHWKGVDCSIDGTKAVYCLYGLILVHCIIFNGVDFLSCLAVRVNFESVRAPYIPLCWGVAVRKGPWSCTECFVCPGSRVCIR